MNFSFHEGSTGSRRPQLSFPQSIKDLLLIRGGSAVSAATRPEATHSETSTRVMPAAVLAPPDAHWSTSLQTVLDQPPSTIPYKFLLGGLVFGAIFVAWAWFGQINEVGHARGQLVPKGQVYKIHPIELGKVTRLAVQEGQDVKAGQVVAELDNQIAAGEVERLQKMLMLDQVQLSQTQTLIERTALEAKTQTAIAQADAQAQTVTIAQAQSQAATAQKLLAQGQGDAAAQATRLERLQPLVAEGAIAKEQTFEVEQALRDRQRAITQQQGELQQALSEAKRLQAGLAQKQAEGRKAQLEAQQRIQQLEVQATELEAKISETQNLLVTAQAKLQQRFLYAPVSGVVLSLDVPNTGEVVQPGQTIAEISPSNAPLVLSAALPNQEAGFVKPGMQVQVKLDAYPFQEYGIIPGKVLTISPATKPDERLGPVYRLEIALNRHSVTTKHQTVKFKAGQTATADVIIRRRRIMDILLDPLKKLQHGAVDL
ncbi:HlyD family efflux transporter periplasmic adaptor subunit [Trichocoleus desertorum AS-A10]|uniref:HlyD family efflux transporter periplasmic adaptor subunit n=1 Tax=Trichocoleus desertorum TaxID=1481672 RepID=UPI0032981EE3